MAVEIFMTNPFLNKILAIVPAMFLLVFTVLSGDYVYANEPKNAPEEKKDSSEKKDKKTAGDPKLKEIVTKDKKDDKHGDAKHKEKDAGKKDDKHGDD